MTIGILVPVLADGYHAEVMTGIGDSLLEEKYFYFIAHHRHRADLIEQYPRMLISRGAEGLITIDTNLVDKLPLPVVAIAGHRRVDGVTNVVLDHHRAAELSLCHLYDLGHRTIAFMRGQPYSSDSDARWQGIVQVAQDLGLIIRPELTIQLDERPHVSGTWLSRREAAPHPSPQLHCVSLLQRYRRDRLHSCAPRCRAYEYLRMYPWLDSTILKRRPSRPRASPPFASPFTRWVHWRSRHCCNNSVLPATGGSADSSRARIDRPRIHRARAEKVSWKT